ncbi:acyl carrier protein [Streptomyces sp. NPDC058659]|uniref:acyl carrier protein n=1 Tax=unclassified Streptomyces TaxID=2593676 RepID=UPI00364A3E02
MGFALLVGDAAPPFWRTSKAATSRTEGRHVAELASGAAHRRPMAVVIAGEPVSASGVPVAMKQSVALAHGLRMPRKPCPGAVTVRLRCRCPVDAGFDTETLRSLMEELFGFPADSLALTTTLDELGLDSLALMELGTVLEERTGVEMVSRLVDVSRSESLDQLARMVSGFMAR